MRLLLVASPDPEAAEAVASSFGSSWSVKRVRQRSAFGEALLRQVPELIFVDIRLLLEPRESSSGEDANEELQRLCGKYHAPVVVLTPPALLRQTVAVVKGGASTYLTLPVDPAEVDFVTESLMQSELARHELRYLRDDAGIGPASTVERSSSPPMQEVLRKIRLVAPTQTTVLLFGETGVGKSTLARLIHSLSNRAQRQLISVHCGAIPDNLLESELFGHERGAFTGAVRRKLGKFEVASGGTIFLDEVGLLTPAAQIRLLGVIQERMFQRVGGESDIHVNVRIVAATNIDLRTLTERGEFRRDLFYRLNVFPLEIPPLRERREDLSALVQSFLAQQGATTPRTIRTVNDAVMQALMSYQWPGNVRELENLIERACILDSGDTLSPVSFPAELFSSPKVAQIAADTSIPLARFRQLHMDKVERQYLERQLQQHQGRVKETAQASGVGVRQLHKLLLKHGLLKEHYKRRH